MSLKGYYERRDFKFIEEDAPKRRRYRGKLMEYTAFNLNTLKELTERQAKHIAELEAEVERCKSGGAVEEMAARIASKLDERITVMESTIEKHRHTFEYLLTGKHDCECDPSVGFTPCIVCALDRAMKDILSLTQKEGD